MLHRRTRLEFWGPVCLWLLLAVAPVWAAEPYQIDHATAEPSASLPKAVVDGLNPQGWMLYTESNGLKEPICEVFLAKTVAGQNAAASGNLQYGTFKEGALLGVVHLLPEATDDYSADSHNQKLTPGYYTMRYGLLPAGTYEHGIKMGEFVILTPVSLDHDPARIPKPDELKRDSASGSNLDMPVTMELVAPDASSKQIPNVTMDDAGTGTFQARVPLTVGQGDTKDLRLAIRMLTPVPHDDGS